MLNKLKIQYNSATLMYPHVHGRHDKDMIVLHETVSPDIPGMTDIMGVEQYLAAKDYGIHGCVDKEGNIAWAKGLGNAIFWQAGGVNERSIGIEQVSRVMLDYATMGERAKQWSMRKAQLNAVAKLVACISRAHNVPLVRSEGSTPGVTTHWNVSQIYAESEGHTDCWPLYKEGYYPLGYVIKRAKYYKALYYHF